ncbi:signal recognition particle-docking protein FtsY [bacterium]|nr:signal recognition particle-docking protein FtsY [bacterium]
MRLFKRKKLEDSLYKTRKSLLTKIGELVGIKKNIDSGFLGELEEILITSDIGVKATLEIIHDLENRVMEQKTRDSGEIYVLLKEELKRILYYDKSVLKDITPPEVILIAGVNGTGKTTTIAKLAYRFKEEGKKVLISAADTFRAAAQEQLGVWAERLGADIVQSQAGADAASVAYDTVEKAILKGYDCVIIDTAGRLHTKSNLMEELKKVQRVISKKHEGAPHEILLVIDATTGQNGILQAQAFNQALNITGIVLTKLDGTAKGGIVLAIKKELNIPVKYVGIGEKLEDLIEFNPEEFVEDIIGK